MPPVCVLIKPASGNCQMACSYCFYKDELSHRQEPQDGYLSMAMTQNIIQKALAFAEKTCTFMFQGGEPTLRGLDFYREFLKTETKYARPDVTVYHALQTNGLCIDENWAAFFAENRFLIGLSLDGFGDLHNYQRPDMKGDGTFNRVMKSAGILKKYGVDFNILCVVTDQTAVKAKKLYAFFRKNGFSHLQFIPCLSALDGGKERLSVKNYGDFLIALFDCWYEDILKGQFVSIRFFDNLLQILSGNPPEECGMSGKCGIQFVTVGNGDVYPCDFYVLDEYKLGNAAESDFYALLKHPNAEKFIRESLEKPEECRHCPYYSLCQTGCRRLRILNENGSLGKNRYCDAYRRFYETCLDRLIYARTPYFACRENFRA